MRMRLVAFFVILGAGLVCLGHFSTTPQTFAASCSESTAPPPVTDSRKASDLPSGPNLKESIDARFAKRYAEWKTEFLAAEIARAQWELHAKHPHLTLTITVSASNKHGAGTGNYKWNDKGELIEATIFLGSRIDQGYPNAIYYPVMNAIEPYETEPDNQPQRSGRD